MKRSRSIGAGVLAFAVVAVAVALLAPSASAHVGRVTNISCTQVTFTYSSFPSGANSTHETVSIDGNQVVSKTFNFNGSSASDTVAINVGSGTHTVSAHADWTVQGGGHVDATKTVTCPHPPCPTGTKANFRWHYSANGSSGSWSATKSVLCPNSLSIGPQAMEGDLKVAPGATLRVGYSFTVPGNHATLFITVGNPQVVFNVRCVSGATPSAPTFTVNMPTQTYQVTDDKWYPSGDQHSSLVYQGSIAVPNLCGGGKLRLDKGGTFSANVS
jgi:hypothetical protein